MAIHDLSVAVGERNERRGSVALVVLVAAGLIAAAAGLVIVGRGQAGGAGAGAGTYVVVLLALLGVVGVFSLLALATGLLLVSGRDSPPGPGRPGHGPPGHSHPLLEDVVENAHDGIVVADGLGRVLYANAAYRLFADAAAIGDVRPVERVFGGGPDLSEAVYRLLRASQEGRRLQEEVRIAGARGEPARWLRLRVHPLEPPAAGAGAARTVWTVADVTRDRERQENVFQDLERAFRYLDHAPAGFFSADSNGDMGYINATLAGWLDYDVAEVGSGGLRLADILPGGRRALLAKSPALPGEVKTEVLDLDLTRRDGGTLAVRLHHKVAFAADGSPGDSCTLVLNRATPVSAGGAGDSLHAAEMRLMPSEQDVPQHQSNQSQKMELVGKLAGGIAHDFNNLLTSILLATDFLLVTHKPTDASYENITQIRQDANRASNLVRQLLAFSRQQTLRPEVLDLGEALSELSMMLRRLIGERVTLELAPPPRDLWRVKADQTQFEQVIINLAVNAKDAMPEGGKLALRTANVAAEQSRQFAGNGMPSGEYVLIEAGDTGTGMLPKVKERVFEPFFTTKEPGKGTGLGLSTVYGIVKQTGGFIDLDSTVGKGTTFRIFLPRHCDDARQTPACARAGLEDGAAGGEGNSFIRPASSKPAPAQAGVGSPSPVLADDTGRGTILLVEDEGGLRRLNARALESRGYTVLQAANGIEAIASFDSHPGKIDLVLSDVVMPEMGGRALFDELRMRDPNVKIIFVSGYAGEALDNLPEGQQYKFLAKPFSLKQLIGAVKETTGM
jgi:signal transduction histidine kinase